MNASDLTSFRWGSIAGLPGNQTSNPIAAVDTTGWTYGGNGSGATFTLARVTGLGAAPSGATTGFRTTCTVVGTGVTYFGLQNSVSGYEIPVLPGQWVSASADLRPSVNKSIQFNIEFRNSAHAYVGNLPNAVTVASPGTGWRRLTQFGVAPAGAAYAYIIARINAAPAAGDYIDVTGIQMGYGTLSPSGLQVVLDGDSAPLAMVPDSLVDPLSMAVGARVRVEMTKRKAIIHGTSLMLGTGWVSLPLSAGLAQQDAGQDIQVMRNGGWVIWRGAFKQTSGANFPVSTSLAIVDDGKIPPQFLPDPPAAGAPYIYYSGGTLGSTGGQVRVTSGGGLQLRTDTVTGAYYSTSAVMYRGINL